MDDCTLYEVLVTGHVSGMPLGCSLEKIKRAVKFTENDRMELNVKKCKEMVIDFRNNKTVIPLLKYVVM